MPDFTHEKFVWTSYLMQISRDGYRQSEDNMN